MNSNELPGGKLAYKPNAACRIIDCGRTSLYGFINTGQLEAIKIGSGTLITHEALLKLLASLPRIKPKAGA